MRQSPLRPGDHFALAVAYQQHGRFPEARQEYATVLELSDNRNWYFAVKFNLAEMLSLEHRPAQAMIVLEQLMEGYPEQEVPIRYFERAVLLNAHMNCDTVLLHSGPHTVCASY